MIRGSATKNPETSVQFSYRSAWIAFRREQRAEIPTHFVGIAALSGRSRPLVRIHMLFAFAHGSLL